MPDRPTAGTLEGRSAPDVALEGRRLRGMIPYGVESRDLGGWREVIDAGALRNARLDDLVATVDHAGVPIGRYPRTLTLEDTPAALHWSVELPEARSDVREAVQRGDLCGCSWRMIVARDRWEGDVRHIEAIAELRDVSVVTTPAYASAAAEYRSAAPTPDRPTRPTPQQEAIVPDTPTTPGPAAPAAAPAPTSATAAPPPATPATPATETRAAPDAPTQPPSGGLRVADRVATSTAPIETRVLDAMRAVPRGEARDLVEASGSGTAAPITPREFATFLWDNLRPAAVVLQTGVRVIPTNRSKLTWPVIVGDAGADFYAELEQINDDDPTLEEFEAIPRAVKALVRASSEAFDDSDPSLREVLQQHLTAVLGARLDRELLRGASAGTDGFDGLVNLSGAQVVAMAAGATASWDPILKALGALADVNAPGPYAVILHPRAATALSLLKETDTGRPLERPSAIPAPLVSSALPLAADLADGVVFSVPQVAVVRRQDATVEVDRSREFDSDGVLIRGKLRATMAVPHPQAVAVISGMPAPVPTA